MADNNNNGGKKKRGFGSMDPEEQRDIARKGGEASHGGSSNQSGQGGREENR